MSRSLRTALSSGTDLVSRSERSGSCRINPHCSSLSSSQSIGRAGQGNKVINTLEFCLYKCRAYGLVVRGVASHVRGPGFDSRCCWRFSSLDLFELVP